MLSCCTLTLAAFAAKDRDWQVGRVLDSAMSRSVYETGTVTHTSGAATAYGSATANTTGSASTIGNVTTLQSSTAMSGMATARSESVSSTAIQRVAVQTNELLLVTHRYLYVIEDTRSYATGRLLMNALANRKHGCRFVVGEDIQYVQEKGYLWVLDPDGKECKIPIVRQQVLEKDGSATGGAPPGYSGGPAAPNPPQPVPPATPRDLIEIAFTSNPPGALVSIYGMAVGRTPFITKLAPGTYKAVFSVDGYYDLTQSVSIGPGCSNLVHAAFELK
jgi:hypothetical protein